jgi:hypothetical protein
LGWFSYPTLINDRGVVSGIAALPSGELHGVVWERGGLVDLGNVEPTDINNRNQLTLVAFDAASGNGSPFLVKNGKFRAVDTPDGRPHVGAGLLINERGHVAGSSAASSQENGRAFFWHDGEVIDLDVISEFSFVLDMNDRGLVVGEVRGTDQISRAAVWDVRGCL